MTDLINQELPLIPDLELIEMDLFNNHEMEIHEMPMPDISDMQNLNFDVSNQTQRTPQPTERPIEAETSTESLFKMPSDRFVSRHLM